MIDDKKIIFSVTVFVQEVQVDRPYLEIKQEGSDLPFNNFLSYKKDA